MRRTFISLFSLLLSSSLSYSPLSLSTANVLLAVYCRRMRDIGPQATQRGSKIKESSKGDVQRPEADNSSYAPYLSAKAYEIEWSLSALKSSAMTVSGGSLHTTFTLFLIRISTSELDRECNEDFWYHVAK
jgi:hypothetical protein